MFMYVNYHMGITMLPSLAKNCLILGTLFNNEFIYSINSCSSNNDFDYLRYQI